MRISIINGPNLNLLGKRETDVYGSESFEDYLESLKNKFPLIEFTYFQSNVEGEIINEIQRCGFEFDGIIINAGGYTHTSVAIGDALRSVQTRIIEVHISNVYKREDYRHKSMISPAADGIVIGFGLDSYRLAIESFLI